jgi:hypothetical protein
LRTPILIGSDEPNVRCPARSNVSRGTPLH